MGTAGGPGIGDLGELHGVPEYDDGGEQVHSGDAIVLAFAGSIPDFTSAVEADGALEGVVGLTLVEADLILALTDGIKHPVDHEQGSRDAAHLPKCYGQPILARISAEIAKHMAEGDTPRPDL